LGVLFTEVPVQLFSLHAHISCDIVEEHGHCLYS